MEDENKKQQGNNTTLAKINNDAIDLGLDLVNNREQAIEFFDSFLKGRTSGVTNHKEAMMVYGRCRELNLPFFSVVDRMCIIGGKVCADIHIKNALALRAGRNFWTEKVQDYEPHYQYSDGTNYWVSPHKPIEFLKELSKDDPMAEYLQYAWDEASTKRAVDAGKTPFGNTLGHNAVYDNVTTYKGYRMRTLLDGTTKVQEGIGSFSTRKGHIAQLGYGSKNSDYAGQRDPNGNWGKYEERMVDVRALDNLYKAIASDLMMGMSEIGEMAEAYNIEYTVNPQSGEHSVQREYKESVKNSAEDATIIDADESQE